MKKKWKYSNILLPAFVGALCCVACPAGAMAAENAGERAQTILEQQARTYPNAYFEATDNAQLSPEILAVWWEAFDDPILTELVTMTLADSPDLKAAQSRVNQARAQLGISKAQLLPWLDASGSWTRTQVSDNAPYEMMSGVHNDGKLGLDAAWEIDVFGRQRANVRAASNTLQAEQARLYAACTSLSGETAINYISLRTLQERLRIAEAQLAVQKEQQALLVGNYQAGLVAQLPVQQGEYTMQQTAAEIPLLRTSIEETMNRLAILTGQTPGALEELLLPVRALPEVDSKMYYAIPADALLHRPDVRAAERDLAAQMQRTKSAKADMKPRISLFGSIGLESASTGNLFSGGSKGFSFGPSIHLPIFHAGAIRKNIRVQTEKEEEYLAVYEKTVLSAVGEVRDALTAGAQEHERGISLEAGRTAAEDAMQLAETNYRSGLGNYLDVLDAQRSLYAFEESCAASRGQELIHTVQLFKAMGGGWQPMQEAEARYAEAEKK